MSGANHTDGGHLIWEPDSTQAEETNLSRFMVRHGITTYDQLMERSVREIEWFWDAVIQELGIEWYQPYTAVLDTSLGLPWAKWFVGGQLNIANDCLDKQTRTQHSGKVAVIWEGEEGAVRRLTYADLLAESNRLANGLRQLGIDRGDRVGIFMPMIPEVVIALMATAKVGAVITPIFSGYAPQAVAARLRDSGARLLITADGFYRRGQAVDMKRAADQAAAESPCVEHILMVRRLGSAVSWQEGRDVAWDDLLSGHPDDFANVRMESEDALMLIYTSGTTGRPKGAVHVHAGFPIKAAQDLAHAFDLRGQDVLFWYSDIGWMMGPWLIYGSLLCGSTMLLYEGAPDYPSPDRIWTLVERHGVTHLGVSPTLIRAAMAHEAEPVRQHDLRTLRVLGSTGEPWNLDPYIWFFEQVGGGRCPIINYSGGTEISGGILGACLLRPLKAMSFAGPIPGMAADVCNEQGESVRGEVGELVIRKPWPGMTRGFWQDPDRYLQAYWSRWPDLWVHGDWASVDDEGFWYIHGRSDDTMKIAGKRLGPAEVESALVSHPAVLEAAAIGVPHAVKGEAVVGFVVLRPGYVPSESLRKEMKDCVTAALGKALGPEEVKFTTALPKTRNAKVMRRVIKARYLGQSLGDLTSLENPEAVEAIGQAI